MHRSERSREIMGEAKRLVDQALGELATVQQTIFGAANTLNTCTLTAGYDGDHEFEKQCDDIDAQLKDALSQLGNFRRKIVDVSVRMQAAAKAEDKSNQTNQAKPEPAPAAVASAQPTPLSVPASPPQPAVARK
jgi:hypothetical protein